MRIKGDGSIMNKAYERETEMWNQVFKECTPVDLRTLDLQVETMFDEALKLTLVILNFKNKHTIFIYNNIIKFCALSIVRYRNIGE